MAGWIKPNVPPGGLDRPPARRLTVAQFLAFDRANPQVWELFRTFTLQVISRGFRNYGASGIWERMRWHMEVETPAGEPWKVNNDYRAFYARKFMLEYPEYLGFFRRRESVADGLYPAERLARVAEGNRLWSNRGFPATVVESSTKGLDSPPTGG